MEKILLKKFKLKLLMLNLSKLINSKKNIKITNKYGNIHFNNISISFAKLSFILFQKKKI